MLNWILRGICHDEYWIEVTQDVAITQVYYVEPVR
jgi:hypothetical protein